MRGHRGSFNTCLLPVEMCPKCRRHLIDLVDAKEGETMICEVEDCGRLIHAKGLCGSHYQAMRSGRDPRLSGPRPVHAAGWTPPTDLSPAWKAAARPRSQPAAPSGLPCALSACAGTRQHGSDLCPAHDHYRATQVRLKAQGLA